MSKYNGGDKFIIEITGCTMRGLELLYEVNGFEGLLPERALDNFKQVEKQEIGIDWESECKRLTEELNIEKAEHCKDVECLVHETETLKGHLDDYCSQKAVLEAQMEVVRLIFGN